MSGVQLFDDSDVNLRVEAIGGFAAFANGLPMQTNANVPSMQYLHFPDRAPYKTDDTFAHFAMGRQAIERDERKYLLFWKNWWAQHGSELTR